MRWAALATLVLACGARTGMGNEVVIEGVDGSAGQFASSIRDGVIAQGCMPAVPPDPVRVSGTLVLTNTGASPSGPMVVSHARLVDAHGQQVATFDVDLGDVGSVPPATTSSFPFSKVSQSLEPAHGCILSCGQPLTIVVDLSGTTVSSGGVVVTCLD
jgi:hypothetical protein